MTMAGLPLVEHLPPPNGSAVLLLGGTTTWPASCAALATESNGMRSTPVHWCRCAGSDARPRSCHPSSPGRTRMRHTVILLDQLALTVLEEEALAEAARVLRPGGSFCCAFQPPAGSPGSTATTPSGTSRRSPIVDMACRKRRALVTVVTIAARTCRSFSSRTSEGARYAPPESDCPTARDWRFLSSGVGRCNRGGDTAIRRIPETLARLEGRLAPAGRGYWLVAVAERLSAE